MDGPTFVVWMKAGLPLMGLETVLTIRIDEDLRRAFRAACEKNDMTMAQVIRRFVRDYTRQNAQASLPLKGGK